MIELLETYGQGGNCGYDHPFYYDNSFLVIDRARLFVLETSQKKWAVKSYRRASISNRLSIGSDAERYGGGVCDFAKTYSDPLYTFFFRLETAAGTEHMRAPDAIRRCGYGARTAHA